MKQSIKYLLFIVLLLPSICSCNPKKQEKLCGHIVFLHIGEENYTIWPLMILTGGDTSYLEYKKLDMKKSSENFVLVFTLPRKCITINADSLQYKTIKDYLMNNKYLKLINDNPESVKLWAGTFKVIIHDNRDSLGLIIPHGKAAQAFFSGLLKITKKYNNENLTERLSEYEGMQSVWVDNKK